MKSVLQVNDQEMVIQPPNLSSANPNVPNLKPSTMQRQGGFFGKSRHAPVSAIDIKRNNEQTMNHRPPGVGPESATGGNMTPLGNANLTPLGKPNPGSRQNLGASDTQSQVTAPISHEPTHLAPKAAVNAQVNNDTNPRVGNESTDKERDANRPRKSVMRKVRLIRNTPFLKCIYYILVLISYSIIIIFIFN